MQLRHMKTVQPAAEGEGVMQRVTALTWAPNNMRLAAVTTDRIVHLFDENGERRDKFSTKPADSKVRRCTQTRGATGAVHATLSSESPRAISAPAPKAGAAPAREPRIGENSSS